MPNTSITNITTSSIKYQITGLSNYFNSTYYQQAGIATSPVSVNGGTVRPSGVIAYVDAYSSGTSYNAPSSPATVSSGFTPGRSYTSYGWIKTAAGQYYNCGSATYTMLLSSPSSPVLGQAWTDKLYVTWGSVTGALYYEVRWKKGISGSYTVKDTDVYTYYSIPNLDADSSYYVSARCFGESKVSNWSSDTLMKTLKMPMTPWVWANSNVSGDKFLITGTEWLYFIAKIQAVRDRYSLAPYGFTTTASYFKKGEPFYYWMFRQASQAIDDINGQVPNNFMTVNSGDKIYGWWFDTLATALNSAINNL